MVTEAPERRWWLQVRDKSGAVIHDGTCVGDAEVDATLKALEARPDFGRFSLRPENAAARPTVTQPRTEPAPAVPDGAPLEWPCRECGMPEPECRRREHISGHAYDPVA